VPVHLILFAPPGLGLPVEGLGHCITKGYAQSWESELHKKDIGLLY
jgi:hypothetical protein